MVIIIRSNEVNPDPRVQKYIDFLKSNNVNYEVIGWNRNGKAINKENFLFFNLNAKYGMGYSNIINKLRWFLFIIKYLIMNRNKYNYVHACDLDTALPVYIASLITRKKLIFDIFDLASTENRKDLLSRLIKFIEMYIAEKSDYLIICEDERREQLHIKSRDIFVMPNIPNEEIIEDKDVISKMKEQDINYDLVLSYVGVFDVNRGIEDTLKLVANKRNILLNIAGFGSLEEKVVSYARKYPNIVYWGKVNYNTGLNIMKNSDLILAMYYKTNPHHKYAAPNKYYEGLMLGVPIITTRETLVGKKTDKYETGFVIDEGIQYLEELLEKDRLKFIISLKKKNCSSIWNDKYKEYINIFMQESYNTILNN
jgi:glycosyltransferase involved in cell wall biosynthesis